MINNTLVYFDNKNTFEEKLNSGDISNKSIVFIFETGEIWTHGRFFTDYEEIKRVLFENGPGSISDALKNLRNSILGGVSEDYNTLAKIAAFLENPLGYAQGAGILLEKKDNNLIISANVDNESIETTDEGKLKVKTIDGGTY